MTTTPRYMEKVIEYYYYNHIYIMIGFGETLSIINSDLFKYLLIGYFYALKNNKIIYEIVA